MERLEPDEVAALRADAPGLEPLEPWEALRRLEAGETVLGCSAKGRWMEARLHTNPATGVRRFEVQTGARQSLTWVFYPINLMTFLTMPWRSIAKQESGTPRRKALIDGTTYDPTT